MQNTTIEEIINSRECGADPVIHAVMGSYRQGDCTLVTALWTALKVIAEQRDKLLEDRLRTIQASIMSEPSIG